MQQKTYIAIDLKSFYASVECVERGLNPLTTNLVVADIERTEKTICLAVSPPLKEYGIPGRPRLFEVAERVRYINSERLRALPQRKFSGKSAFAPELKQSKTLELDYIVAQPRMALYVNYSKRINNIYLKYIAPEDILVYSIDEVFIDVTPYLGMYKMTAYQLAQVIIRDILKQTGITATAGIGTNLYLAKIAMDIYAKQRPPDKDGVRIAELDETTYRQSLWGYKPLTKFWQIGRATAEKLKKLNIDTMGKLARYSLQHTNHLYKIFGIKAEILIDHAWGCEPCTIECIKKHKPLSRSISAGQVLEKPYSYKQAKIIVREMAEEITLRLTDKNYLAGLITLTINYDSVDNQTTFAQSIIADSANIIIDRHNRKVPKPARGSHKLKQPTASFDKIMKAAINIYEKIANPQLLIRRLNIGCNYITEEENIANSTSAPVQLDLFTPSETERDEKQHMKELTLQKTIVNIKKKMGRNAILRGIDFDESATTIKRNKQIGGHRA